MEERKASIAGFEFQAASWEDGFEKSIVRHDIPYADFPILEDMGLKGRTVRIRCWFHGPLYELHKRFIESLRDRELVDLVHPKYGLVSGKVEQANVRHDRRLRTAEVDIVFVQGLLAPEEKLAFDITGAMEAAFTAGVLAQQAAVEAEITDALGPEGGEMAAEELDPDEGILDQLSHVTGTLRAWAGKVNDAVATMEGTLAQIEAPANSLISTIDFATNLPGRVVGAVARTADRYAQLYMSIRSAPDRFVQSFRSGMTQLDASLDLSPSGGGSRTIAARNAANETLSRTITVVGAQAAALHVGYAYFEDEERRNSARTLEGTKAFGPDGSFLSPPEMPELLTVRDIEISLGMSRAYIQEALSRARENAALRTMAYELLRHANSVMLEKEKLKTIEIYPALPLHIVCLRHGLPYNHAPRILAMNPHIQNPSAISGEVLVYAK